MLATDEGIIKLADFGVSAQLQSIEGRARTFIGTPYWMAPEVIACDPEGPNSRTASYNTKADIWSIGITAIELAQKEPPLAEIHPMRAMYLIPNTELGLAKPKNFSKPFNEFIKYCLVKDPLARPTATEVLEHPFLAKAKASNRTVLIRDAVRKARIAREKKKMGIEYDDDDDEEMAQLSAGFDEVTMAASSASGRTEADLKRKESKKGSIKSPIEVSLGKAMNSRSNGAGIPSQYSDASDIIATSQVPGYLIEKQPQNINLSSHQKVFTLLECGKPMKVELLTADVLDNYLLLGCEKGLYFIDLSVQFGEQVPHLLIKNVRFRQISVQPAYNVIMALSGKHDHVRQYKLSSIRKLIRYALQVKGIASVDGGASPAPVASPLDNPNEDDLYLKNKNEPLTPEKLAAKWANDYIKILSTRDSHYFTIKKTETSIYMVVMFRAEMILFEWAKEPYLRFMKIKAFWLPETPRFVEILTDGFVARELYLGYEMEANLLSVHDSKVKEIPIHESFTTIHKDTQRAVAQGKLSHISSNNVLPLSKICWQTFIQVPNQVGANNSTNDSRDKQNFSTVNRKLAAIVGPTISRSANSSQNLERLFVATYGQVSVLTDVMGRPLFGANNAANASTVNSTRGSISQQPRASFAIPPASASMLANNAGLAVSNGKSEWSKGIFWQYPPEKILLEAGKWVFAQGPTGIQVLDYKTAEPIQNFVPVEENVSVSLLTKRDEFVFVWVGKKKKGGRIYCFKDMVAPAAENHQRQQDGEGDERDARNPSSGMMTPGDGEANNVLEVETENINAGGETIIPDSFKQ